MSKKQNIPRVVYNVRVAETSKGSIELCHLRPEVGPIAGGGVLAEGTAGPVPTSKGV